MLESEYKEGVEEIIRGCKGESIRETSERREENIRGYKGENVRGMDMREFV